ncbi:hypothetical protein F0562_022113 [Nyssa sinensis]|uniref:Uncharacterized protein n=1 Tax=Nyssa sinensis TaxID=561372 RepID=A0A5J5BSC6_9ASTE|nr:hypothetical protein F0562_022113 [Nyssa sinensis]
MLKVNPDNQGSNGPQETSDYMENNGIENQLEDCYWFGGLVQSHGGDYWFGLELVFFYFAFNILVTLIFTYLKIITKALGWAGRSQQSEPMGSGQSKQIRTCTICILQGFNSSWHKD